MRAFIRGEQIGIFGIAVGIVIVILAPYLHLPFQWAVIISVIIIAGSLLVIFWQNVRRIRPHRIEEPHEPPTTTMDVRAPPAPVLTFSRTIVRGTTNSQHGGVYHRSTYFVEVVNGTANTTARNCRGSITLVGSDIVNRPTVWENNNRESIDIGHREFLYLFKVETFRTENGPDVNRLYFTRPSAIDHVDERSRETYDLSMGRRLTVLIQSDNASFPSEANSFGRTVQQIINDAIEEF